jgi:hypothetical protein
MKYFLIQEVVDSKLTGVFPQVQTGKLSEHINNQNGLWQLQLKEANEQTFLPLPFLHRRAKITDLLSVSFIGFSGRLLVSEKLNTLLFSTTNAGVQSLETVVQLYDGSYKKYFIINPYLSDYRFLDFLASNFFYVNQIDDNKIPVKFISIQDFINTYQANRKSAVTNPYPNHKPLLIQKVVIKENCDLDFFSITPVLPGGIEFVVSERLKKAIVDANCTGIIFKEF